MDRARLPLRQVNSEPTEPVFRALGIVVGWLFTRILKLEWRPGGGLPQRGGLIVVANHISNFDPLALGHFIIWHGRWPRYLGKAQLWRTPFISWLARACGQIAVERNTDRAKDALAAAKLALAAGKCVVIYPEGTVTADPEGWPMTGRKGAARLALETGCPVVPIGQWGAHEVMGFKKITFPRLFPRKTIHVAIGAQFPARPPTAEAEPAEVAALTEAFMDRLTDLVAELRGEAPPQDRYDMRAVARVPRSRRPSEAIRLTEREESS